MSREREDPKLMLVVELLLNKIQTIEKKQKNSTRGKSNSLLLFLCLKRISSCKREKGCLELKSLKEKVSEVNGIQRAIAERKRIIAGLAAIERE